MSRKRAPLTPAARERKAERDRAYRQRRVAEAKAAGLPSSVAYGHGKRAGRPSMAELREAGTLPPRQRPARPARPPRVLRHVDLGAGGDVYRTGSKVEAERILKAAAEAGQNIAIRGTFQVGAGWRQVTLDGTGAEQRAFIAGGSGGTGGAVESGGEAAGLGGGRSRLGRMDTPHNRQGRAGGTVVQITVGGGGVDAADVWAAWLAYDGGDWWDFLADWADSEY